MTNEFRPNGLLQSVTEIIDPKYRWTVTALSFKAQVSLGRRTGRMSVYILDLDSQVSTHVSLRLYGNYPIPETAKGTETDHKENGTQRQLNHLEVIDLLETRGIFRDFQFLPQLQSV